MQPIFLEIALESIQTKLIAFPIRIFCGANTKAFVIIVSESKKEAAVI